MSVVLYEADCLDLLPLLDDNSVDSVVTDPPYHLTSIVKRFGGANAAAAKVGATGAFARASKGFMGQAWDGGDIAFRPELWAEVLRVLKPGGHIVAFSGTRTYHRMACAIEDAGFEIRDQLAWTYGSGFPKSHDVAKAIDKAARGVPHGGADPTSTNHGKYRTQKTEGKRSEHDAGQGFGAGPGQFMREAGVSEARELTREAAPWGGWGTALKPAWEPICLARKPLIGTVAQNVLAYGVGALNIDGCRVEADDGANRARPARTANTILGGGKGTNLTTPEHNDLGRWPANILHDGEAGFGEQGRFFYCAKASKADRGEGNNHPTVKPTELMRWLCRLITPPDGTVLDPFTGSGSTGRGAVLEGFGFVGIEMSPAFAAIARGRIDAVRPAADLELEEMLA